METLTPWIGAVAIWGCAAKIFLVNRQAKREMRRGR